jgi:hypothetical protein
MGEGALMSVCGECGRENPEGVSYCGFCAAAINADAPAERAPPPQGRPHLPDSRAKPSIPPNFRPAMAEVTGAEKKGGIEWLPWKELSGGQKFGRLLITLLVLALGIGAARNPTRGVNDAPLSANDRSDGVRSLCKVFQIYGMPLTEKDAEAAAKNAQELFSLAGNESPGRSAYILITIAKEFRTGKLKSDDCAAAGEPVSVSSGRSPPSAP